MPRIGVFSANKAYASMEAELRLDIPASSWLSKSSRSTRFASIHRATIHLRCRCQVHVMFSAQMSMGRLLNRSFFAALDRLQVPKWPASCPKLACRDTTEAPNRSHILLHASEALQSLCRRPETLDLHLFRTNFEENSQIILIFLYISSFPRVCLKL